MEMENLVDLAKILKSALDSLASKKMLLIKSLYLEIDDLGHLAKPLKSAAGFLYIQN